MKKEPIKGGQKEHFEFSIYTVTRVSSMYLDRYFLHVVCVSLIAANVY